MGAQVIGINFGPSLYGIASTVPVFRHNLVIIILFALLIGMARLGDIRICLFTALCDGMQE